MTERTRRPGRPETPAAEMAESREGCARFSVELPRALIRRLDADAKRADRSRAAQIRVLLTEIYEAKKVSAGA